MKATYKNVACTYCGFSGYVPRETNYCPNTDCLRTGLVKLDKGEFKAKVVKTLRTIKLIHAKVDSQVTLA
jgi:hypothetical protein